MEWLLCSRLCREPGKEGREPHGGDSYESYIVEVGCVALGMLSSDAGSPVIVQRRSPVYTGTWAPPASSHMGLGKVSWPAQPMFIYNPGVHCKSGASQEGVL